MARLKWRGRPKRGAALWDYLQEHVVVMKDEKVCPFMKFDIILPLFCCLLYPLINKHCRTWSSLINLWIYSRNCQKYRILLSARQRYNNYLELSKESVMGNMMLSHWPCFTWKFFMIWFHKILKLLFQDQSSCLRNICTRHWRKLLYFHSFLGNFLLPWKQRFCRTCVKPFVNFAIHLIPR